MMQKAPAQQNRWASCISHRNTLLILDDNSHIALGPLIDLLGEYFQIRDDYKNLTEEVGSAMNHNLPDS